MLLLILLIVGNMLLFAYFQYSSKVETYGASKYEVDICKAEMVNQYKRDSIENIKEALHKKKIKLHMEEQESVQLDEKNQISLLAVEEVLKQVSYVEEFDETLNGIFQQADSMNSISIFSNQDSFTKKNIEKTKEDFSALKDSEITFFSETFLTNFFQYMPVKYISIIIAVVLVLLIDVERKKGISSLVFSTSKGRVGLFFSKLKALSTLVFTTTVILYVSILFFSFLMYGGGQSWECLSYKIQSVPMFASFVHSLSIGTVIVLYIIFQCVITLVFALFLWLMLMVFKSNILALGVTMFSFFTEFLLYFFIPSTSGLHVLKYVNIMYYFYEADVFTEYKNLNIFSNVVGKEQSIVASMLIFSIIVLGILFLLYKYKHPISSSGRGIGNWINGCLDFCNKKIGRLSVTGLEIIKILVYQKGIVILIILCLGVFFTYDVSKVQFSQTQELFMNFLNQYEGVPGKDSDTYINDLEKEMDVLKQEYLDAAEQYEQGKIGLEQYVIKSRKYESFAPEREFLAMLMEQRSYLQQLKESRNIDGWYLNYYGYKNLLANEGGQDMKMFFFISCMILLFSGVFAMQKKSLMKRLIASAEKGRKPLFLKKIKIVFLLTLIIWFITTAFEVGRIIYLYGLTGFSAPVQSLKFLGDIPFTCNIGIFVGIVYLLKFLVLLSIIYFVCFLSNVFSQRGAICLGVILFVPFFLGLAGINIFQNISLVSIGQITPLLMEGNSIYTALGIVLMVIVIGCSSVIAMGKRWSRN